MCATAHAVRLQCNGKGSLGGWLGRGDRRVRQYVGCSKDGPYSNANVSGNLSIAGLTIDLGGESYQVVGLFGPSFTDSYFPINISLPCSPIRTVRGMPSRNLHECVAFLFPLSKFGVYLCRS
jgi:hypothetical protein